MTKPILPKEDDLVSRLADHGLFSQAERNALFGEAKAEIIRLRAALAATPAVGGGLEALADHIEYEQARGVDIPLSDGEAAQIVAMLRAVPPASPLRGREILLALAKRHAEAIGELGEAQADKRSIDALSRNWLGGRVNGLAIALEVARVVVSAPPGTARHESSKP